MGTGQNKSLYKSISLVRVYIGSDQKQNWVEVSHFEKKKSIKIVQGLWRQPTGVMMKINPFFEKRLIIVRLLFNCYVNLRLQWYH